MCVLGATGCGAGDNGDAGRTGETVAGGQRGTPAEVQGNSSAGRTVFQDAGCGDCHVLRAAGSKGTTGPNLDEQEFQFDEVVEQVEEGGGGMPSFRDRLSETDINNVAAFVVESTEAQAED